MPYYERDEYYRYQEDDYNQGRRAPPRGRMSSNYNEYLVPNGARPRSHSQGGPEIHIHNDMFQEATQRAPSPVPPPPRGRQMEPMYYPVAQPAPPPPPMAYAPIMVNQASRSRSRSHSNHHERHHSGEYWEMKHNRAESKAKEEQERAIAEYRRRRDEEETQQKRAVADFERRKEQEKDEQKRAIDKYKADEARKAKEEKDEEEAAIRKWEQEQEEKKKKKKAAEEEAVLKWQREQEAKKKKAEEEEKEWIAKLKAKEEAAKEKKKKEKEEEDEAVRKRLSKMGLSHNQVEAMMNQDDKKDKGKANNQLMLLNGGTPVFPKIHRDHIDIETLKFYDLPWEYDRSNPHYIIILQELDERSTNVLFEHTKRIRSRTTLTIEAKKGDKPEYAWVRRRSKSRGKSPSGREKLASFVLR